MFDSLRDTACNLGVSHGSSIRRTTVYIPINIIISLIAWYCVYLDIRQADLVMYILKAHSFI